jgi:WD40 repeat protein
VYARNDRELVSASLAADQPRDEGKPGLTIKSRTLSNPAQAETASVLAFDPNGRSLATGSWHGSVKLIDPADGKELAELPRFRDSVSAVAFSRNGRFLVAAGGSEFTPARNAGKTTGQVKLWDAATRQEIAELAGHTSIVFTAVFSPDSQTLATGSADHSVRLWEAATGKEKLVLTGHTEAVRSVAFSPDGALLASASTDKSVILWDTRTGEQQATLNGHEDEVRCVAFSPGGELLASGSADWTIRVWDVATDQPRQVLKGHQGSVTCLIFYHNQALLSGSGDQTLKLWSLAAGQAFATLRGHRSSITSVVLSPDEKTLVSAGVDDPVRAWDLTPSTLMEWQR